MSFLKHILLWLRRNSCFYTVLMQDSTLEFGRFCPSFLTLMVFQNVASHEAHDVRSIGTAATPERLQSPSFVEDVLFDADERAKWPNKNSKICNIKTITLVTLQLWLTTENLL